MSRVARWGYSAGWGAVRALPRPVAAALFRAGADFVVRRRSPAVLRLAGNLRRVVGPAMPSEEFDALVRRAMRSYARYWMETFRLPSRSHEQILHGFRLERGHLLIDDVASGRGAIVALPHGGNWDAAGAWVAASGLPITTVVERLKPEEIFERFLAFRRGLGMDIIPLTGGERPVLESLEAAIGKGHVVPLLADRDLSSRGVSVRFFGGKARMPAGPAALALRTGAPLYVVDMWYEADIPVGYMHGPLTLPGPQEDSLPRRIRTVTQLIADQFERGISAHPEDWHMLQRLWLD